MFSIPDDTVHRTKVADWLELKAIASPDALVGFETLASAAALAEDGQNPDVAAEDVTEDQLILRAQAEIQRRHKHIGNDYPFRIDDKGRLLHFITPLTTVGSIYLFCLFISHAFDRTVVPKVLAPKVPNKVRDLFQACATVAAGGYVKGPAISFGFPRPDGSGYLKALHRVYGLFGDGKPHKRPRAAAARKIKDNGIDVIAWRPSIDGLASTLYLVGQVASGKDWTDKSVKADREHFHKFWFEHPPASQAQDAMFMPLGLEPDDPEDGTAYDEVLRDHMQSLGYQYGTVFYRDRLARHLADGLQFIHEGEKGIERVDDLARVVDWVDAYCKKLREAAVA